MIVMLALGGLAACAAAAQVPQPASGSSPEMAKYNVYVGKDYWVNSAFFRLCKDPTSLHCLDFLARGTHLKIDALVPNQAPDGRAIFDPYYHVTLDDGRSGYFSADLLVMATDVNPVVAAAECKRRGEPRIGMTVKQLEATCWGKPLHVNRRTTAKGTSEQYVYGSRRYVDVFNGLVTAIDITDKGERRPR